MDHQTTRACRPWLAAAAGIACALGFTPGRAEQAFLPRAINSSTIPANGDLNPYGVAFVPRGFPSGGLLGEDDVLVANFNSSANIQGTGTSIIVLHPHGPIAAPGGADMFFASKLPGLSTALGVLRHGFVLVGNVPTTDGTFATIGTGALQVIDRTGKLLHTWTDAKFLDGPWDLAIDDEDSTAHVFVANVLNGTVTRLDVTVASHDVTVQSRAVVANGYTHVPNAAAVVLGPTGLAFDPGSDTLFVASTADNAIYAVAHASHRSSPAGRGDLVFVDAHLRGPLALRFAPNGHLLTANGDAVNSDPLHPSELVEFTRGGQFVREYNVDASQGGAFGIDTVLDEESRFNYAVIDDVTNSLLVERRESRW
jgi:DNA-binding beta-propeller fold protein YncE